MFDMKTFSENLRKARTSRGLSQENLAKILYISSQSVSKWERGNAMPDIAHICALADALQMSLDALLGTDYGREPCLIAVDGGGSKTEFVLISPQGQLLKRIVLSGSNPNSLGVEGCCAVLQQGIDKLLQERPSILHIYIGCSGMFSGDNAERVYELLHSIYPDIPITCQSDICNLLAFAQNPDNAIAVICGTGSAIYATRDGKLFRSGGGGWKLDTLGSGYDLGRQALLAAMEARDDTGPATMLTQLVEQRLGGKVWEKIQEIYAQPPAFIASFAPLLLEAWQKGDAVAEAIVNENCRRIAFLIDTAIKRSPNAKEVIFGGSIVDKCLPFQEKILSLISRNLEPKKAHLPQIWGSCLCCAKACGLTPPDEELFMQQYEKEK